jgi:hypothetical protein
MEAHMKLRHLFTINIFIAAFFGLACAFFPAWSLHLYGLDPNPAAIWTTRLTGGSILGFAALMYFGRTSANPEARRAIALALLIQDLVGLLASLEIQLRGSINTLGWSNLFLYGLLALGYAWFLFVRREEE